MNTVDVKIKNALRIDRALKLVWQASPLYTVLSAIVIGFIGVMPLISLYLIKLIIDSVTAGAEIPAGTHILNPAFSGTLFYIGLACGVGLLMALLGFAADYIEKAQAMIVADHMYTLLHQHSSRMDLAFYESPEYKNTLFRAQQEGPYRPNHIVNGLFTAGQAGVSFLAVTWLLADFSMVFPAVMVGAAVPGIWLRLKYSNRIYGWQEKRTEDERRAYYFHWMLTGDAHAKELRLFQLAGHFIDQFRKIRKILKKEKLQLERRRALGDFIAQASVIFAVFGSFVHIALKTAQGEITIGDMVMYFQAFQRGVGFLKTLLQTGARMYEDNLFLSHFYKILGFKPSIVPPAIPVAVPEKIQNEIKFEKVDFIYPGSEKKVLKNINFFIKPGEIVALVGENGSGKSTIVKLFTRLYDPSFGGIFLDGINVNQFHPDIYRQKISVVFQEYIKYYLKVSENIILGDIQKKSCDSKIRLAAQKSGIHSKINRLSKGYDTILGRWFESGEELSWGQWQMLAIARAFFRDSEIVILDEPSSALDPKAEASLFETLRQLMENRMALIISHKYSSVKLADRILVMDKGQIVEQGNHLELLKIGGKYAQLYHAQANICGKGSIGG
jgi:ATP-binding cassette subfamily B protein